MICMTLDVETTHKEKKNGGHTPLPYFGNKLVSVGYKYMDSFTSYLCFNHSVRRPDFKGNEILQDALRNVDVLIGHNIKFDIAWLRDCGFVYDNHLYDTMVAEYILASARRWPLGLKAVAEKYGTEKKKDLENDLDDYIRDLKDEHDRKKEDSIRRVEREFNEKLDKMKSTNKSELSELKSSHKEEMSKLRARQEEEERRGRKELEEIKSRAREASERLEKERQESTPSKASSSSPGASLQRVGQRRLGRPVGAREGGRAPERREAHLVGPHRHRLALAVQELLLPVVRRQVVRHDLGHDDQRLALRRLLPELPLGEEAARLHLRVRHPLPVDDLLDRGGRAVGPAVGRWLGALDRGPGARAHGEGNDDDEDDGTHGCFLPRRRSTSLWDGMMPWASRRVCWVWSSIDHGTHTRGDPRRRGDRHAAGRSCGRDAGARLALAPARSDALPGPGAVGPRSTRSRRSEGDLRAPADLGRGDGHRARAGRSTRRRSPLVAAGPGRRGGPPAGRARHHRCRGADRPGPRRPGRRSWRRGPDRHAGGREHAGPGRDAVSRPQRRCAGPLRAGGRALRPRR